VGGHADCRQASRFEFDLNRPREQAVYLKPEDAWGLPVWQTQADREIIARSLAEYDAFYETVERVFADLERRSGRFLVFDLPTYNHLGPQAYPLTQGTTEINLGTGTLDHNRWAPVVETSDLRDFNFLGRRLDVRENIRFRGGHFSRWTHQSFLSQRAC